MNVILDLCYECFDSTSQLNIQFQYFDEIGNKWDFIYELEQNKDAKVKYVYKSEFVSFSKDDKMLIWINLILMNI